MMMHLAHQPIPQSLLGLLLAAPSSIKDRANRGISQHSRLFRPSRVVCGVIYINMTANLIHIL